MQVDQAQWPPTDESRRRLVELYRAVFTLAPWHEDESYVVDFGRRIGELADSGQPTRLVFASDADRPVGFALAVLTPAPFPTDRAHDQVRDLLGDAVTATLGGCWEVDELAVHPDAQGGGVGRTLLAAVLGDDPGWLVTWTGAPGALSFYDRVGLRRLGASDDIVVFAR